MLRGCGRCKGWAMRPGPWASRGGALSAFPAGVLLSVPVRCRHLHREAKQRVPPVLLALDDPLEAQVGPSGGAGKGWDCWGVT
jgi:hypothetical protein